MLVGCHVLSNALAFLSATELPPASREWLDMARRSAEWLGHGLAQLRNAGRWRAGGWEIHPQPLDIGALVGNACRTFAAICATRRLALCQCVAPEVPVLAADPLWLPRAVTNLLSNAVRCTPDGGTITISAAVHDGAVEISVRDTGIGIDEHLLGEIFEPFSLAAGDPSLHGSGRFEFRARGLGLGLAITKAIVLGHGGALSVRSSPGCGSTFTIRLPVSTSAVAASPCGGAPLARE